MSKTEKNLEGAFQVLHKRKVIIYIANIFEASAENEKRHAKGEVNLRE